MTGGTVARAVDPCAPQEQTGGGAHRMNVVGDRAATTLSRVPQPLAYP